MDLKWDQGRSRFYGSEPQRDFLAEATNLALQLDPVSWDFDLSDRDVNEDIHICNKQQLYFNNTALATVCPILPLFSQAVPGLSLNVHSLLLLSRTIQILKI